MSPPEIQPLGLRLQGDLLYFYTGSSTWDKDKKRQQRGRDEDRRGEGERRQQMVGVRGENRVQKRTEKIKRVKKREQVRRGERELEKEIIRKDRIFFSILQFDFFHYQTKIKPEAKPEENHKSISI